MTLEETVIEQLLKQSEQRLIQRLEAVRDTLEARLWPLSILEQGLKAFQKECRKNVVGTTDVVLLWRARITQDPEITYPQRKILDRLLERHDPITGAFKPVQFTQLVRDARVGKGRTNGYLEPLIRKGIVRKWSDGYRTFVCMATENTNNPTARRE